MKPLPSAVVLLVAMCVALAGGEAVNGVHHLVLNDREVIDIPVSRSYVTTVRLPTAPLALDAANVTIDGRTPGAFQLAYQPGASSFAIRALVRDSTANVNVTLTTGTFALRVYESDNPYLSVTLVEQLRRKVRHHQLVPKPSPSQLIGILDMAKGYPLLSQHHPSAVQGVSSVRTGQVMDYGDFEIRVEEVFRFDQQDVLVFKLQLRNKTPAPISYAPHSFSVRVGARLYPAAVVDASGVLPVGPSVPAYIAVVGNADGSRAELSLKNSFTILIERNL